MDRQLSLDKKYRCMAVVMSLYRFIDRIAIVMLSVSEEMTLLALADYAQLSLEREPRDEFTMWRFAVHQTPRLLKRLGREPDAKALNDVLARGEYMPVVLRVAGEIFTSERGRTGG